MKGKRIKVMKDTKSSGWNTR